MFEVEWEGGNGMFNFTGKSWIHFSEGTSSQSKEIERKSVKSIIQEKLR